MRDEREPSEVVCRPAAPDDPSWLALWLEPVDVGRHVLPGTHVTRMAMSRSQLQSIVDAAIALGLVEVP